MAPRTSDACRRFGRGAPDFEDDLDDVVDMALGVDAAGDGEAHEIHLRSGSKHQSADFYGADSAFQIKFCGEGYAGELVGGDVREEGAGVEIYDVATGGLYDGNSLGRNVIAE